MSPIAPIPFEAPHNTLLHQAQAALQRGDVDYSQALSKSALLHAQRRSDAGGQARALLYLSQGDRQMSRMRRARETAQRAVYLFQTEGDATGEAEALTTLSHVLSVMGHSGEGVEAALLAIKLCENRDPIGEALARNYLGVAYAHSQSFDKAAEALHQSIRLLEAEALWPESCLPRFHLRAAELQRCFFDRYYHGAFVTLEPLQATRDLPELATSSASNVRALQCPYRKTRALLELSFGFESCWSGDLEDAARRADAVCASVEKGTDQPSVRLMEIWLRAEIAWAQQDWLNAESHAQRLQQLALRAENEHLRATSHLLLAQLYSAQAKDALAQTQLRLLKMQETHLRNESLHSREERVEWQLRARAVHAASRQLELEARRLEQLALQDALTGLYNRRHLEQMVPGILARAHERGLTPGMAFVDVDHFKRVNDRFSHRVGDEVLKALAHILSSFVREGDVPVRLGGDEFVVVFTHVDAHSAQALVARIHKAVNEFDWGHLRDGLEVTASCGLALAQPQDTLESWLHRCDLSMYVEKDSRHQDLA